MATTKRYKKDKNAKFVEDLMISWRKCKEMESNGATKSEIGHAFYSAMLVLIRAYDLEESD